MTLVFYDTETTGTETGFDQILQFAAIQTDAEFNEIDRFEIRSRISPYVVPAPGAMRVTGITAAQLAASDLPSHYEMVCRVREKLVEWSPATFVGYNSIEFDEYLLRQALYKNLFPPYLTNTNGNSRTDVMRAVQAASLYVPNALAVPLGESGKPVFKLDLVAPANGYPHEHAHDALDDVRATIHVARLLDKKGPDVWSAFMRFSSKASVIDHLAEEPVVALSDFYYGKPHAWHVTLIGQNPVNSSEQIVFNLGIDPDELAALSDAQLVKRLSGQPKPVRGVRSNAAPMLMPADEAPEIAASWSVGFDELENRADRLRDDPALCERLVTSFIATRKEREASPHVENQIYDGFFLQEDQNRMDAFHQAPWADRPSIVLEFQDARLRELGMRLIHAELPDVLDASLRTELNVAAAHRLAGTDGAVPWLTLPKAIEQVDDLIAVSTGHERTFLEEHRNHLTNRLDDALPHLS